MTELLLFFSVFVIFYLIYWGKNKGENLSETKECFYTEIESLRAELRERESHYRNRELNLNRVIQDMQSNMSKQQDITKINNEQFEEKRSELVLKKQELQNKLDEETLARKKILSQKKSGEVRLGHIAETLAPFLDQFDFEPERCSFMGQPIDYISFGDDEITFIEIKSGNSQLSQKQRHIRDLVKAKLVSWKEVRIK